MVLAGGGRLQGAMLLVLRALACVYFLYAKVRCSCARPACACYHARCMVLARSSPAHTRACEQCKATSMHQHSPDSSKPRWSIRAPRLQRCDSKL